MTDGPKTPTDYEHRMAAFEKALAAVMDYYELARREDQAAIRSLRADVDRLQKRVAVLRDGESARA